MSLKSRGVTGRLFVSAPVSSTVIPTHFVVPAKGTVAKVLSFKRIATSVSVLFQGSPPTRWNNRYMESMTAMQHLELLFTDE